MPPFCCAVRIRHALHRGTALTRTAPGSMSRSVFCCSGGGGVCELCCLRLCASHPSDTSRGAEHHHQVRKPGWQVWMLPPMESPGSNRISKHPINREVEE